MPRDRKDYFTDDAYETASESDNDRTKKDERIRQAPYLPRIQIWARDSGPYTLRIGHQWFHCDDLLINGDEYRTQAKRLASNPSSRPAQPNNESSTPTASRRTPLNRAPSYQRTRQNAPGSRPVMMRQPSRDKVERSARYESQAVPEPRRKHVVRKSASRPVKATEGTSPSKSNLAVDGANNSLVPYKPPTSDPPPAYKEAKQPRPGRLSRGNSYQVPVRSKGRKAVKFAPLPN